MARSRPTLTVALILAWADDHHARTGEWPRIRSGPVRASPGERWQQIDAALRHGHRGLAGGSSLPQLLAAERGCRNHRGVQALTVCQILAWADDHRAHHGDWPRIQSGPVRARPGETWRRLDNALRHGAGTITLTAITTNDHVELHVTDEGDGLPTTFLPHAFERFSRAQAGRTGDGTGLGLAIVELIASAHGGQAGVTNRCDRSGADAWLRLPAPSTSP